MRANFHYGIELFQALTEREKTIPRRCVFVRHKTSYWEVSRRCRAVFLDVLFVIVVVNGKAPY